MKSATFLAGALITIASLLRCSAATQLAERDNPGISYVEEPYTEFQSGGHLALFHNYDWVTLSGTGYLRLRWEVEYWKGAGETGDISAEYDGEWTLVAGGEGFQFADSPAPSCNNSSGECDNALGGTDYGYTSFDNGANHWHNKYYWLDGSVTLQTQEGDGLYNVAMQTSNYDSILDDISDPQTGDYHVGVSCDPTEGACPCEA